MTDAVAALNTTDCSLVSSLITPAPTGPVQTEDGQRFELRPRGASVEGYDKLELPIGAVRVTAVDGAPLKVQLTQERVDVAGADHAPVTFEAPVHELSLRGRAVVQLDVARSLVDLGSHRLLLPNGIVNY
ncbi:hypothetical protein [Comamonas sp. JC664]|uniref:hypothetical protein n=1 Tax=Comamonas sp. JC664 TaxID=2801917 RepID=UPI0019201E8C|nr:hypothetical protein [Comamonas sp. JC664]MBL0697955.1 hypothetical protein [Comamonas sp. JC664]GHG70547.1 hypothetical protein GCM10012319_15530 [Comamonas sp. KCTC 72670]